MNGGARLQLAPEPFIAEYSERGALRQPVGAHGRVHIDRSIFFLMLHRSDDPEGSIARHVATTSPAYLIWGPEDDLAAAAALETIVAAMRARHDRILLVSLYDQALPPETAEDSPRLPPFTALIGPGDDAAAARAADALGKAMAEVEIDLRRCHVEHRSRPYFEPSVEALIDSEPAISHFSFGLPPIHISPSGGFYPQMFRDLSLAAGDSLLRAACSFISDGKDAAPPHYRALGRSAFLSAALKTDRQLDKIARSFDFLLSISPINSDAAMHEYLGADGGKTPRFQYRPLEVDPDIAKRDLYSIDLTGLEDPLLETLFTEKRRELDHQLTMIAVRNSPDFRPASMLQYGVVEPELLAAAQAILDSSKGRRQPVGDMIGASEVGKGARALIADYARIDDRFDTATVEIRDDLAAGLMVSGKTLMISSHTRMARHRLDALLAHEVSVHLLTWFNGSTQGLGIFRSGLARYEGVQEGLGVFAEWAVGGLTTTRLRLLAGRVLAVDAMVRGADFNECYALLEGHGFRPRTAFGIAARVYRSGGFAKDAIYLRGFKAVVDAVAAGLDLDPFWLGKIAPGHLGAVEELLQRGLLQPPVFRPLFLDRPDVQRRIAGLSGTTNFNAIFDQEQAQ